MTKLTPDASAAIESVPYLAALPAPVRDALATAARVRAVPAGASIFLEGEPPAGVFLVLTGRVQLVRGSADGRQQVLHEEGAGATLAEVPVFDGKGYVASAVVVEDARVLFVPRAPLLAAIQDHPAAAAAVIRVLAGRVRRFAALAEDLSTRGVAERLARYLAREAGRSGTGLVELPATRQLLAAHLGTVREQASRALSRLRREGTIAVSGRRVHITDAEKLRALAGDD